MCSQTISLSWDNHHSLLISVFKELLENNIGVNCTIVAEGHHLKAHQVLLSSFSPLFELLFKEENEKDPTIILTGTSYRDMRALMYYMYHGKLEISQDRIKNLLETAKYLQIKGLSDSRRDDSSQNTNLILPHRERQSYYTPDVTNAIPAHNNIVESQSYKDRIQYQTSSVSSIYHVGQSSDGKLEESFVQRLPAFSGPSTCISSESNYMSFHGEPTFKVKPQDETFLPENMLLHDLEIQEDGRGNHYDSNINNQSQETSEEANDCLSSDASVKSEDNSKECVLLQDCTASSVVKLPSAEWYSRTLWHDPVDGPSQRTLNVSSVSELNATRDTPLAVDPTVLESNELFNSELDVKPDNGPEEENAMLDGASVSSMEQRETLIENEHIATGGSECFGEKYPNDVSSDISSLSCSLLTPGVLQSTHQLPRSLPVKSSVKSTRTQPCKTLSCSLNNVECKKCMKSFRCPSLLHKHMCTQGDIKPYTCTQCVYTTNNKDELMKHQHIHTREIPYKCDEYEFATGKKQDLHRRVYTRKKPFKCAECDFAADRRQHLLIHLRVHTGERPYKCAECSFAAATKANLMRHFRIHTGERPYKCAECNFAAARKDHLIIHSRVHNGGRPYKCAECDFATSRKCTLITHRRLHTRKKCYKCTECDFATAHRYVLNTHRLVHTVERP